MWNIVFPENLYKNLNKFLFSTAPFENGCFLLANSYTTANRSIMLITEILKPDKNSWNNNDIDSLEPTSTFINQCVIAADRKKSSLIFVHTHPDKSHPSKFSWIDENSNDRIFANLSNILVDLPLGSLVFSRKGICGVVFDKNKLHDISKIKIIGNHLSSFPGVGFEKKSNNINKKFDRQMKALGKDNQEKLQDITITIVGLGGTGSPVAVQLARMGVKKLQLVDMDVIDKTNIPRVYGSNEDDVGKSKVDVLKKHLESFSDVQINSMQNDVSDKKIFKHLIDSDVIFGCTDNLTSRFVLNDISTRYLIPLIDIGCRIHLNQENSISQAVAKVQLVTPHSACLWCTGTLDGKIILQESLSNKEKRNLAKEGYYDDIEKQPSIISITSLAASMAVNKLLDLFGIFGNPYNSRIQIEVKNGFMINDNPKIKNNCICQKNKGKILPEN